jgi:hypothetical protein
MANGDAVFYEEDGNEIIEAVTYMMEHKTVPRMDIELQGNNKKAKVYWAGTVLRIDIEGLR